MSEEVQGVRDLVLMVEKTLSTRNLYASNAAPYNDANEKLFEKYQSVVGDDGFTLRLSATDIYCGKSSVIHREQREDPFYFCLFRDGLRQLVFSPGVTLEELDQFLGTLEAERKGLIGPTEDTVSFLWRCDLSGITFTAIDGIGDEEGDDSPDSPEDEYRALVADVMSKIQSPASAVTGQKYSFRLDADSKVAATDLKYEATTTRRAFEDNPTVLQLSEQEVGTLRAEVDEASEEALLEQFIEILVFTLMDPAAAVPGQDLAPVFEQLLGGFWGAGDFGRVSALLGRLFAASKVAPVPENRDAAGTILQDFLTTERIEGAFELLEAGTLPLEEAVQLWEFVGNESWDPLVGFTGTLSRGELRTGMMAYLRNRLSSKPDLLRRTLVDEEAERVLVGLALLDDGMETMFAHELHALASHEDETVRLKAVGGLGKLGDDTAVDVLWKVMESDAAKPVRLLAFRVISGSNHPELPKRLEAIVNHPGFDSRPVWEREKYVRLLGNLAGDASTGLFESWIPQKRFFWQQKDHESTYLALCGLAAIGGSGLAKVQSLASGRGKLGDLAKKALAGSAPRPSGVDP